jgi:cytochrome c5
MRKNLRIAATGALLVFLAPAMHSQTVPSKDKNAHVAAANPTQHQSEGQRILQQNCSRCHNPPEGFSPRISGTIVRHMRVRAQLSKHDQQELLRFFNP